MSQPVRLGDFYHMIFQNAEQQRCLEPGNQIRVTIAAVGAENRRPSVPASINGEIASGQNRCDRRITSPGVSPALMGTSEKVGERNTAGSRSLTLSRPSLFFFSLVCIDREIGTGYSGRTCPSRSSQFYRWSNNHNQEKCSLSVPHNLGQCLLFLHRARSVNLVSA